MPTLLAAGVALVLAALAAYLAYSHWWFNRRCVPGTTPMPGPRSVPLFGMLPLVLPHLPTTVTPFVEWCRR
jgi:hypothetical protein